MSFTPTDYLPYDFANRRHIGPSPQEMTEMLRVVGAPSLDALIDQTVPASIRSTVVPDFSTSSCAFPTRRPGTSVIRFLGPGFIGQGLWLVRDAPRGVYLAK